MTFLTRVLDLLQVCATPFITWWVVANMHWFASQVHGAWCAPLAEWSLWGYAAGVGHSALFSSGATCDGVRDVQASTAVTLGQTVSALTGGVTSVFALSGLRRAFGWRP